MLRTGDAPPQLDSFTERERDAPNQVIHGDPHEAPGPRCGAACAARQRSAVADTGESARVATGSTVLCVRRRPFRSPPSPRRASSAFAGTPASSPLRTLPNRPSFSPELRFELRYIHNLSRLSQYVQRRYRDAATRAAAAARGRVMRSQPKFPPNPQCRPAPARKGSLFRRRPMGPIGQGGVIGRHCR